MRFQPEGGRLELRNLMAGAVVVNGALIEIIAPLPTGNIAEIHPASAGGAFDITVNGQAFQVPSTGIQAVYYAGSFGGQDTFANLTDLTAIDYGWGGNNFLTEGTGPTYAFLFGDDNTFEVSAGGFGAAYNHGGQNNIGEGILVFQF
jgi:hypothetical protein